MSPAKLKAGEYRQISGNTALSYGLVTAGQLDGPHHGDEVGYVFGNLAVGRGTQPEPFLHAVSLAMANPKWSLADALGEMLSLESPNKWSATWRGLTGLQQAALKLIFDDRPPTSADSVAWAAARLGAKVQPSSISRALESLGAKGILERRIDGRGWMLIDPVQRAWLRRNPDAAIKSAVSGY